jgi:hypothetical protein
MAKQDLSKYPLRGLIVIGKMFMLSIKLCGNDIKCRSYGDY